MPSVLVIRLAQACVIAALLWTPSFAEGSTHLDLEAPVPGRAGVTVLDLVRSVVPDLAKVGGGFEGHPHGAVRPIDETGEPGVLPETIRLYGASVLDVRSGGLDRVAVLIDFGNSPDLDEGFAVLALFDVSGAPRLLDAANVAYDRMNSFQEPGRLSAGDNDILLTGSSHFNSSQGYMTTALILARNDRLELIDTVFTFTERLCAMERVQEPSFRILKRDGGPAPIEVTVTETTTPADEGCDEAPPEPGTRAITVTYDWDASASRYVRDSDALERLAKEDAERF